MATEVSTIQSLKAVDAWIDVINANINGGVRTAFKQSRLRFAGSNTQLDRPATASTLPLQFPEPSLVTANTVIDFTQGAVTSSTETSHLAIQGTGFFLVASPDLIETGQGPNTTVFGTIKDSTNGRFYITRDGEFHTNQYGLLVNSAGYYLVTVDLTIHNGKTVLNVSGDAANQGVNSGIRAVYNDIDNKVGPKDNLGNSTLGGYVNLTDFVNNLTGTTNWATTGGTAGGASFGATTAPQALLKLNQGQQNIRYTQFGSTVYDFGYTHINASLAAANATYQYDSQIAIDVSTSTDATVLSKSLEASNSSMTQSVPELSLAQKLFSALTKVIQIHQTNTDSVINLIR